MHAICTRSCASRIAHTVVKSPHSPLATRRGVATKAMEKISFGSANLPGYIVGPADAPGVILLQEWWGITDVIKEQAEMISQQGFRCLVPDLYKGKVGVDKEEASHLMNHLDFKGAIDEVSTAVQYLRDNGAQKVGCVGFCMGGALTFCAAQHSGVDAAAPFYGTPDPAICDPTAIKVPVQAHFGELDTMKGFSDTETVKGVLDKMKAAKVPVELFMYPKSGHAFMNALTPAGKKLIDEIGQASPPDEEPKAAFDRLIAFFKQHLS